MRGWGIFVDALSFLVTVSQTTSVNSKDTSPAQPGSDPHGWREEGSDLLRAIAAGSIVGMPLLYTMEMWTRGVTASAGHLLLLLAGTLLVNFVFSLFSGFRRESSVHEAASESVTAVAIGLVYSLGVLCLIGEITFDQALSDLIGKVLIETAPVSLGISFANYHLRNKSRDGDEEQEQATEQGKEDTKDPERLQLKQDLIDLAATVGGAFLFAYNVAPTEEIIKIATRLGHWQHLLLMLASLGLCYMILFATGFQERRVYVRGMFQSPWAETTMAYAVSLLVACALLYLVGVPEATSNPAIFAGAAVTLGLPAVVGAAAGRLVT